MILGGIVSRQLLAGSVLLSYLLHFALLLGFVFGRNYLQLPSGSLLFASSPSFCIASCIHLGLFFGGIVTRQLSFSFVLPALSSLFCIASCIHSSSSSAGLSMSSTAPPPDERKSGKRSSPSLCLELRKFSTPRPTLRYQHHTGCSYLIMYNQASYTLCNFLLAPE